LFSASGFALRGIAFGPVGKTAPVCDTSFESDLSLRTSVLSGLEKRAKPLDVEKSYAAHLVRAL